jgi:hypothetical protein
VIGLNNNDGYIARIPESDGIIAQYYLGMKEPIHKNEISKTNCLDAFMARLV